MNDESYFIDICQIHSVSQTTVFSTPWVGEGSAFSSPQSKALVLPSLGGVVACAQSSPLELFLGRSLSKPFHFYCCAQELKSKVILHLCKLGNSFAWCHAKEWPDLYHHRFTLPNACWPWESWSVPSRMGAPQEPTPWVQGVGQFPWCSAQPHLGWHEWGTGQDCTGLGHPHLPQQGCMGRGSCTPRWRWVSVTFTAWEGDVCVHTSLCACGTCWYQLQRGFRNL